MEESHDEGFSIREYVSRMRSVNVVKCWPFDDESATTSEESVRSLLPPITVKKFIWWLDALQHFQSVKNVEDSKKKKTAEKGESSLLSAAKTKSWRAKSKKRSILEIFAAAPLVERADTDEEKEEENGVEEINWGLKGKRNEKKKKKKKKTNKNKDVILNKGKKVLIKKIKKQKKASDKVVSNKENSRIVKLLSDQTKAIESSNSPFKRKKENNLHNNESIHKKKPRPRYADADKKTKACEALFKLTQIRHKGISTKCGILKKPVNAFSQQQQSTKIISSEEDKHVTFLLKDDILRLGRKPSLSAAECLNLHKHYGVVGKDSTTMGYTCPRQLSCMPCEVNLNSRKVEVITSTSSRMTEDCGGSTTNPRFPPLCFKDYLETYNQNSAFHVSNMEKRLDEVAQTSPHFSPRELLQTACFGPDTYQRGNICATRISDENFVGFPVNSQGDFIMTSSIDKGHYNQMTKSSTTDDAPCISLSPPSDSVSKCFGKNEEHTSWDRRTSSKDQLNLFVPSRLNMTGSRGDVQTNLDVDFIKRNDNSFCSEDFSCKEGKWVQRSRGNDKTLSRMRLMGKEFTVGEFGDGDELCFSNLMMHNQNETPFGNLRETLHVPSESTIHHTSSQSANILPQYYDCRTSYMHQNGFVTRVHHNEPLSHAPRSAIRFPFMHPDLDHRKEFSPFFDVSEKGTLLMSNLQPFHNLRYSHNHSTDSSASYAKAEDFCSYNPFSFGSTMRSNAGPSYSRPTKLLAQQAPTLCYPDFVPISSLQKRNQNENKIMSRIGIRSVGQGTTFANFGDVQNDETVSGSWIDSNTPLGATTADFVFSEPDSSAKIYNVGRDPAPMFKL